MFSFGFQQAYQRGIEPGDNIYFSKVHLLMIRPVELVAIPPQCLDAAKSVVRNMVENLAPTGYMRYAPDGMLPESWCLKPVHLHSIPGHFIFASFASAFLLKVCRSL